MSIFTRVIGAGLKAIAGAFAAAILFGLVCGGATLGVAYMLQHNSDWSTTTVTDVIAGVIAVLGGYAAATTSFLRTIARDVTGAAKTVASDAEKTVTAHT